jgi:hypothetical protein
VIDSITPVEIVKKKRRELTKEDLEGNILKNIATNLYTFIPIKILQQDIKQNSIVIAENGEKFFCRVKTPLDKFFTKLSKSNRKDIYLNEQVVDKVKI